MSFFAPLVLTGLLAAAIPVIIHLLRKRTADQILWGAWIFLCESLNVKRSRLILEDIILLALRTLLIIAAVIAFARPFLKEISFFGLAGTDKDVVIVIDTSASMRLGGSGGKTTFENAVEEAEELVRLSPSGTKFGLVVGERTPLILTPSPISDKREIIELLRKIKSSSDAMDVPNTLVAAGEVLSVGKNPLKEVIIFGDGQGYGWRTEDRAQWLRVERVFERFPVRPPVVWRAFQRPEKVKNAAIAAVVPSSGVIGTDRPVTFTVSVVNSGSEAFAPGDAVFSVDGEEKARLPVGQILPGLSRTFAFTHLFDKSGKRNVVTSLSLSDDIPSDSICTNQVEVSKEINVLIVDGRPASIGYDRAGAFVEAALSPAVKGTNLVFLVRPKVVRSASLENEKAFKGVHAAILCDVPMLSAVATTNLSKYVSNGGSLVNLLGPQSKHEYYTNSLFAAKWTNWNDSVENVTFKGAPVIAHAAFDENAFGKQSECAWRYSNGKCAGVISSVGRGRTVTLGFPLDFSCTTLPARPQFVPFVHELVYSSLATNFVSSSDDYSWRSREGDLTELTAEQLDAVSVSINLGVARSRDDALAAIVGKSFGLEIWRPFAIAAILLLLAEILFSRRLDSTRGGRVKSHLFTALRVVAVLAMVWQFMHISWVHDVKRRIHRRVAVITDCSLSMQRCDQPVDTNEVARLTVATNLTSQIRGMLSKNYDVEELVFGSSSTDFAAALDDILETIPSDELSGAVFITDGCDTAGGEISAAARRFARAGAKISSVVVGSLSNRVDAAITSLTIPEMAYLGDKIRPTAVVRASGMNGKKISVCLLEGDKEIEKKEYEINSDDWSQSVRFVHDPITKGVHSYSVAINSLEGDVEEKNEVWPFDVAVSDDRTNVLIIDGRPRWEFRYLRNLFFARDKSVHLQYVLAEPDKTAHSAAEAPIAADATRKFGDAEANLLPRSYDDWRKFDVIVIGDVPPSFLDENARRSILRVAEERGTMVVFIAGERFMPCEYVNDDLMRILPVAITNTAGEVTARWVEKEVQFTLTPSGMSHPVTSVSHTLSENGRVWGSLPPARAMLDGLVVKPGSEILLYSGDSTAHNLPLIVTSETGKGKVVFLATDETWRLRYRTGDRYHHRFWGNIVNWGSGEKLRDGNANVRVGPGKMNILPGEEVKLSVKFTDRDFNPITNANPVAIVTSPNGGPTHSIALTKRPGGNGYYDAIFDDTAEEGKYSVKIEDKNVAASLGDCWPADLSTYFVSSRTLAPVEYASVKADMKIPEEMARLTGSRVFKVGDDLCLLENGFGAGSVDVVEHIEDPIWNHPSALIILIAALSILWVLRKRKGLA